MQDNSGVFLGSCGRLFLIVLSKDYETRGPGFLKFNNSPLEDKNFVEALKKNIKKYKEKYGYLNDKILYWEMIKTKIRSVYFIILYSFPKGEVNSAETRKRGFHASYVICKEKLAKIHQRKMCPSFIT